MASNNTSVFIFRDDNVSDENYEEVQGIWLEQFHPEKVVIGGEKSGDFLVNEEDTAMMCMEYLS